MLFLIDSIGLTAMVRSIINVFWRPVSFICTKFIVIFNNNLYLNFGCGPNTELKPWVNFDYNINRKSPFFIDISKRLPFNDLSVKAINAEHVVEHITKREQLFFFNECFRVMKKGARLRIVIPYADPFFDSYRTSFESEIIESYKKLDGLIFNYSDVCNNLFNQHGHRYIWFKSDVVFALKEVGFQSVVVSNSTIFEVDGISLVNKHSLAVGNEVDSIESLRLDIVK